MNVLVTGAAGYVGSIVTEELIKQGSSVVALDNLQQGHREAVAPEATFVQANVGDLCQLDEVFRRHRIQVVMHLAAESAVGYSMTDPARYFKSNVVYGMDLLNVMVKHGVQMLVFSSTAAVYGEPAQLPIKESSAVNPLNAYGESKLVFEKILLWYGKAYGLRFISLRYFNAAGATERFGEDHRPETHLIPNVLKVALGQAERVPIFGGDYPTKDGTCVRDYIHVADIAKAHVLALRNLQEGKCNKVYNLGNNRGYSVMEVCRQLEKLQVLQYLWSSIRDVQEIQQS